MNVENETELAGAVSRAVRIPEQGVVFEAYSGQDVAVFYHDAKRMRMDFLALSGRYQDISERTYLMGMRMVFTAGGSIMFVSLSSTELVRGLKLDCYAVVK